MDQAAEHENHDEECAELARRMVNAWCIELRPPDGSHPTGSLKCQEAQDNLRRRHVQRPNDPGEGRHGRQRQTAVLGGDGVDPPRGSLPQSRPLAGGMRAPSRRRRGDKRSGSPNRGPAGEGYSVTSARATASDPGAPEVVLTRQEAVAKLGASLVRTAGRRRASASRRGRRRPDPGFRSRARRRLLRARRRRCAAPRRNLSSGFPTRRKK